MTRTITVNGQGKAVTKVDYVVVSLYMETINREYDEAMRQSSQYITEMQKAIEKIGFKQEDLKTVNFHVEARYQGHHDANRNFINEFVGYCCSHNLKISFDYDNERVDRVLSTIAKCEGKPQINLAFTVKNPEKVSKAVLRAATRDAKEKAETLVKASGCKLGELLNINYGTLNVNVYSNSRYDMPQERKMMTVHEEAAFDASFQPEDIVSTDTVTFVWEIL